LSASGEAIAKERETRQRIKADGAGYYHCMSRIIERRHVFGAREKEKFRN